MQQSESAKPRRTLEGGYSPSEVRHALWYVMVAWMFGAAFSALVSGGTFTSFLIKYLKADDLSFGLIMAIGPAAGFFNFLGSYVVERTGRSKRIFLIYVTIHRLLWAGVGAIALWTPNLSHGVRLGLVGLIVFCSTASANYGGAGWIAWISRIVPRSLAGRYFGLRASFGLLSMVIATLSVTYLLDHFASQGWMYALVFSTGAVLGATDILLFVSVREIPREPEAQLPTLWEIVVTPWRDATFRGYMRYIMPVMAAYMIMSPFMWKYCFAPVAENGLGMSVLLTSFLLTIVPWLSMAWVSTFWGRAIDKFGPRPVLALSAICHIILPLGWVLMRPAWSPYLIVLVVLSGLTWPGFDQVVNYMQFKVFPETRRSAFVASFIVFYGLATTIGCSLGGVLSSWWEHHLELFHCVPVWMSHYQPVFLISMLLRLLVFLCLFPHHVLTGRSQVRTVAVTIAGDTASSLRGVGQIWKRRRARSR